MVIQKDSEPIRIVIPDGTGKYAPNSLVGLDIPWAVDAEWQFKIVHADGSNYDLTNTATILTFKRYPTDASPVVAREADVDDAGLGLCHCVTNQSDRALLTPGYYFIDVIFIDSTGIEEVRDEGLLPSSVLIHRTIGNPSDPITIPTSSPPLAYSPPGVAVVRMASAGSAGDAVVFDLNLVLSGGFPAYRTLVAASGTDPSSKPIVGVLKTDILSGNTVTMFTGGGASIPASITGLSAGDYGTEITIDYVTGRLKTKGTGEVTYGFCDQQGNLHLFPISVNQ